MKSYTDLEQSKKLGEILPIESADMCYLSEESLVPKVIYNGMAFFDSREERLTNIIHCWSLAALLDVLPFPQLSKDKLGSGKEGWMVSIYPDDCRYDSCWHDNPVDACYEMILKLHEQKIL